MKQVLQNLGSGETELAEVPCPNQSRGRVLVETSASLISLGTEKMLVDFGRGGLLAKARSQPDKVKQVLQKVKTDGLVTTLEAVRAKLDTPIPLGYCNVGVVVESDSTSALRAGTRVVSNGPHAEVVAVPESLTARVPEGVSDEQAAFTVVGAIGLQGIRLMQPTLGERVVVSGLGLIGLLSVQILRAHGCRVLGIDYDPRKLKLARSFGAETVDLSAGVDPVAAALEWTNGAGVDGVLITASTKSNELMHQVATMCRKRGRIVLVGVVGLNLQRADFYEKELSFQVSCSYGPGRYDPNFEQRGLDYPIGFVRWTEQRNFEAVLGLLAEGKLNVDPLITHRFAFDEALEGYQAMNEAGALGIVLDYGKPEGASSAKLASSVAVVPDGVARAPHNGDVGVAFVGAGGFTTRMLLPLLPKNGVNLRAIVSRQGVSAAHAAKKHGFATAASDIAEVLSDDQVTTVFVTTPHNQHAGMVHDALKAGKHVFVEKPLAMNSAELEHLRGAAEGNSKPLLMVGFNRRFSPHMLAAKDWLRACPGAKAINITVNAGEIPPDHWTQDREVGGGRIIGEACHFIDLARFLAGAEIVATNAFALGGNGGKLGDCASIQLQFTDGSLATIHYLANGSKDFPKERVEVFAGGQVVVCDNFRTTKRIGPKRGKVSTRKQDKGHATELAEFIAAIREGGASPISLPELFEVSQAAIDADLQIQAQLHR